MQNETDKLVAIARELSALGEASAARSVLERCVERSPSHLSALLELANVLWMSGARTEALAVTLRAAALAPDESSVHHNIARIAPTVGRYELEVQAREKLVSLHPGDPRHRFELAETLDRLGHFDRALQAYEAAVLASPDDFKVHAHYGYALLRQGRWQEGWREMGWYWRPQGLAAFCDWGLDAPRPLLREGESVAGKAILVTGWGGAGDMIMFTQLAQHLARRGAARVTLHITDSASLFRRNRWGYAVEAHTGRKPFLDLVERHDAWVPSAHLPLVLGLGPEDLQSDGAYLRADAARQALWRRRAGTGTARKKIGLAWSGNPGNLYERNRSVPTAQLLPLLATEGVDWFVVQKNDQNAELRAFALSQVIDESAAFLDLEDTAALMSELDLVISADTMPAHLAGSIGRPVWLLLSAAGDWRWGLTGDATHWYRSMRIYRQRTLGDWQELLQRVAADLSRFVQG
jgi:hypothetical protein